MSDNYVLALEKDRDTRIAELERCRSEVERFVAEVDRLNVEVEDAVARASEWERAAVNATHNGAQAARERDAWKAAFNTQRRAGAALLERLRAADDVVEAVRRMTGSDETMRMVTAAMVAYDAAKEGK